jgi:hypothetical protein
MHVGPGKLQHRLPYGTKEQVIHSRRVVKEYAVELVRNGKNYMEIRHRKQVPLTVFYPCFPMCILAFRAMTVAATVV